MAFCLVKDKNNFTYIILKSVNSKDTRYFIQNHSTLYKQD